MFILEKWSKYDSNGISDVIGVFSNEKLAKQAIIEHQNEPSFVSYNYEITFFEIDKLK